MGVDTGVVIEQALRESDLGILQTGRERLRALVQHGKIRAQQGAQSLVLLGTLLAGGLGMTGCGETQTPYVPQPPKLPDATLQNAIDQHTAEINLIEDTSSQMANGEYVGIFATQQRQDNGLYTVNIVAGDHQNQKKIVTESVAISEGFTDVQQIINIDVYDQNSHITQQRQFVGLVRDPGAIGSELSLTVLEVVQGVNGAVQLIAYKDVAVLSASQAKENIAEQIPSLNQQNITIDLTTSGILPSAAVHLGADGSARIGAAWQITAFDNENVDISRADTITPRLLGPGGIQGVPTIDPALGS